MIRAAQFGIAAVVIQGQKTCSFYQEEEQAGSYDDGE